MFKQLMIYRLGESTQGAIGLEAGLASMPFTECLPTQDKSAGWVPPRGEVGGALCESIAGQWIMRFRMETRILPASVVRKEAEKRMTKIEEITGRKPGKKQAREIREDTYIQLLPQAFTKQESVWVWIDPATRILALDCGSQTKVDSVLTALFRCVPGLTAAPVSTNFAPSSAMASWLSNVTTPGDFDIDRECELKSTDDLQSTVKYARHHLDIAEVRQHVQAGKVPTKLAMAYEGRVAFTLSSALQVKKIKFLEGVFSTEVPEEDRFDTDTAIATGELAKVIGELIRVLGGHADEPVAMAIDKAAHEGEITVPMSAEGPDPLLEKATHIVRNTGKASISLVQRHLEIGYNRAARLIEAMETAGVVSAMNATGERRVLTAQAA